MAQVKKPEIRKAILDAAYKEFATKGYASTTLQKIAKSASVTVSNIYNYFPSKLDIMVEIYEPWLYKRLDRLATEVRSIHDLRDKLRLIITTVLRDLPSENNSFSNNLIQAISTRPADKVYSRQMLYRCEDKLSSILREALPASHRWMIEDNLLPHFLYMAFDGFAMHCRNGGPERRVDATVDLVMTLILGPAEQTTATKVM